MTKNFLKRFILSMFMLFCWVAMITCATAYVFLTTTWGAKLITPYLIKYYVPFCDISVERYEGTIEKGLSLKHVTINHIPTMKEGVIHIQEIYLQIPWVHLDQMAIKAINGRVDLVSSDPIIFNGTRINNTISGNCYAHSIDAHQVLSVLGYDDLAKSIHGFISNPDFEISGIGNVPHFVGHFFVDNIVYKDTSVQDGFGRLDVTIMSLGLVPSMTGFIILESALVKTNKINIDLTTSKVGFKGNVDQLFLDIHGSSKVEDIEVDMAIKGSLQKPQLIFNSDPPMPEEEILIALVTGKKWSEIENERSSSEGFGLRRKLTDNFNVGMELEEIPLQFGKDQSLGYTKTIEGQLKLTDKFSLNFAKKYLPVTDTPTTSSSQPVKSDDTEFFLEYKRRF